MCEIINCSLSNKAPAPSFNEICSSLYRGRTFQVITFLIGLTITLVGSAALMMIPGVNILYVIGVASVGLVASGALGVYGRDLIEKAKDIRRQNKKTAPPFGYQKQVPTSFSSSDAKVSHFLSFNPSPRCYTGN